ncbi:type II toxin-antitoxin system VapC family toxin [Oryzibacter oryziterrae]|uniref:type II toxin-antitoxin system VapC family toxin n=1 Tax=Oryzibacter oryziterrae TaxID=2766474 RepID=UPI001F1B30D2|nr:type II toxin-antitoxin system VapC family toxin [Oryzibacter oryziterrae]
MRLLLDTHVAIWALVSPRLLPAHIRNLIADGDNQIHVSAASVWEISIKHQLGKASAPPFSGEDAVGYFREAGYAFLPITALHAAAVEKLPPLHADPFDRLLLAQAHHEPMHLVTHDAAILQYGDLTIGW